MATIAEYKFTNNLDVLPVFNSGYTYTKTDVNNGDGTTTRTITSNSLPSSVSFDGCEGLLEVYSLNLGNSTSIDSLFRECQNLTYIDSSRIESSAVITNATYAFYNCKALKEIDLSGLNVELDSEIYNLFDTCESITSINLSGWKTSNTFYFNWLFPHCYKLKTLNVSGWDFSNAGSFADMFVDDDALTTIIYQNSTAVSVSNLAYILPSRSTAGCVLDVSGIDDLEYLSNVGIISYLESINWEVRTDGVIEPDPEPDPDPEPEPEPDPEPPVVLYKPSKKYKSKAVITKLGRNSIITSYIGKHRL